VNELVVFEFEEQEVAFDPTARMWHLTAMHRAAGASKNKAPALWLRQQQTQEFLAALAEREAARNSGSSVRTDEPETMIINHSFAEAEEPETTGINHSFPGAERMETPTSGPSFTETDEPKIRHIQAGLVETREGRTGGTWAHWQLAAAYAHYLDPRFYLQWNEWAIERMMGRNPDLSNLEARIAALEAAQRKEQVSVPTIDADSPLHPQAQAILAALAAVGGGPLSTAEIRGALMRAGVGFTQTDQVKTRLNRMAQRGQIVRVGRGCYLLIIPGKNEQDRQGG
jgi:hypothetical protein